MHSSLALSLLLSLAALNSAAPYVPSPRAVADEPGVFSLPTSPHAIHQRGEQVGEDDVARRWGGMGVNRRFYPIVDERSLDDHDDGGLGFDKRVVKNPKFVSNPKWSKQSSSSAAAAASSTTTSTASSLGYTSSGLALDGTHTGQGTYFDVGLGACGTYATNSDYIVAVSYLLFETFPGATANPNNNPICGRELEVTYGGTTITVAVQDECMGCEGTWDLDFSPTAFAALADPDIGRLDGVTWVFK
ncbi:hypothetical protein MNV49_005554 [Pseudohyphozyma bogoriensis]|nr:hypothetical protein MNV49_005554 [Pseudohyphozyma bogoriensis]